MEHNDLLFDTDLILFTSSFWQRQDDWFDKNSLFKIGRNFSVLTILYWIGSQKEEIWLIFIYKNMMC